MPWHDCAFFEIDMGQHHSIGRYQLSANRFAKLLFGHFIPTIECNAAFSHSCLRLCHRLSHKRHTKHKKHKEESTRTARLLCFLLCFMCPLCLLWLVLAWFVARAKNLPQLHARF